MLRMNVFHHKRLHLCPKQKKRQIAERSGRDYDETAKQ